MKHLLSVQYNDVYKKVKSPEGKERFEPFFEIVLVVDSADYRLSNERQIVRKRRIEDLRFMVSSESLDVLISDLIKIKKTNK